MSVVTHTLKVHKASTGQLSSSSQTVRSDVSAVAAAAKALAPQPRHARWGHLSLCVLDAVYSINAKYDSVVVRVVHRYADWAELSSVLLTGAALSDAISPRDDEQTLTSFLDSIDSLADEAFAGEILRNKQRTSTRSRVLKAAAVRQTAGI